MAKTKPTKNRIAIAYKKYQKARWDYAGAQFEILNKKIPPLIVMANATRKLAVSTRTWLEFEITGLKKLKKPPNNDLCGSIGWCERKIKRTDELAKAHEDLLNKHRKLIEAWRSYYDAKSEFDKIEANKTIASDFAKKKWVKE